MLGYNGLMLSAFANSFKIPELRSRILFTLGLIFICRLVASVPTPGVDAAELQRVISEIESQTRCQMPDVTLQLPVGELQSSQALSPPPPTCTRGRRAWALPRRKRLW